MTWQKKWHQRLYVNFLSIVPQNILYSLTPVPSKSIIVRLSINRFDLWHKKQKCCFLLCPHCVKKAFTQILFYFFSCLKIFSTRDCSTFYASYWKCVTMEPEIEGSQTKVWSQFKSPRCYKKNWLLHPYCWIQGHQCSGQHMCLKWSDDQPLEGRQVLFILKMAQLGMLGSWSTVLVRLKGQTGGT